jgi:hypothetical protein
MEPLHEDICVFKSLTMIGLVIEIVCEIQTEAADGVESSMSMIESTEYEHLGNSGC